MDAKQEILKQCKRSMFIWVGILALLCLIIAVVFTLAELKLIGQINPEYIQKIRRRIVTYWIDATAAPIMLYLILAVMRIPFLRMIDGLTLSEQSHYLETYRLLPWFAKTFPCIVYSYRYIYVFSIPMAVKVKKISMDDIDLISCNSSLGRRTGTVVSVYSTSGESIHFTCSRWDLLALYTLYRQGKIPEVSGIPSNVEERYG